MKVSPNRNFRDHSEPAPPNESYEKLADAIAPRSLSFWSDALNWSRLLARYLSQRRATQSAVSDGQYSHPDGLFYGGTFEIWSNRTIRSITNRYLTQAHRVVVIDFHTGLGPPGNAEIILNQPKESTAFRSATAIWGAERVRTTDTSASVSTHLDASLKLAFAEMLSDRVTAVSLEFGTVSIVSVFRALRAENWLHHHGGNQHPRAKELKDCLKDAFYPATPEWEATVWAQGREAVAQALDHFASSAD